MVKKDMHLQENTDILSDLNLGVKVAQNVAQYPLHHVIYVPANFEGATSNSLGGQMLLQENTLFDL